MEKEILIYRNIEDVYQKVEDTLRKTFKVKGKLMGAEHLHKMPTMKGEVRIRQVVSREEKNKTLSFDSFWGQDKVVTTYSFREDGPDFTYVKLEEQAYSVSALRKYNYMLMSLPVLRRGSMKKLNQQLYNLKEIIEGENK
ncbi:hypothetical protein J3A84_05815 [Proteiniclasticum sp. SCR006]|uniref:DUF3284 domain-containing protein n=1 Tax=Proteiniclasticum aestuarii TaxID=2817862 RepID=A0A939KJ11_9CLOT|nr:hypothetical protein [Proteiniclasticum aestuarii]MBO1264556.1 hypothetical protein [Proteiniclasticum aestuarii]